MNAQRIYKEARPLFWPWCAVLCASALLLLHPPSPLGEISLLAFVPGILLLATLPFGNEFQNRTLPLLLSQPSSRMQIWREKLSITAIAVFTAALVFFSCLKVSSVHTGRAVAVYAAAAAIVFVASAPFWTLFTRSTVGGVVLTFGVYTFIFVLTGQALFWERGYSKLSAPTFIATSSFVFLGYAGLMLWLGWRKLKRFQAIGDVGGDDLLTAGPDVLPTALVGWLRCRPTGAVLNLIRKEIRLLRPVWLISLLAAAGWACLTLTALVHRRALAGNFGVVVVGVGVITTLMIAILAGSLSLGEEKTSGTHSLHLTLPVSARRQWFIKLFMALVAGFSGAGLAPLLIAGRLMGPEEDMNVQMVLLAGVALLTIAAFWCACAVKGTVPAVLWALPVIIAVYSALRLGKWAGPALTNLFLSRFDPFSNVKFADAVSRLGANAFFRLIDTASNNSTDSVQAALVLRAIILVPALLYAVVQSYRLFRVQLQDRVLSVVRSLLPLAVIAFLCSFASLAFYDFVGRAAQEVMAARDPRGRALLETVLALQTIHTGVAKLDAAHPLQLTVEDLAQAFPLSKSTRRLLGNSHITLFLDEPPHHAHFGCPQNGQPVGLPALGYSWYSGTIPLADGTHFFVAFDPATHYVISAGICAGQPPPLPVQVP